jgi:hypothetical protein
MANSGRIDDTQSAITFKPSGLRVKRMVLWTAQGAIGLGLEMVSS